jgi:hypothetical protein
MTTATMTVADIYKGFSGLLPNNRIVIAGGAVRDELLDRAPRDYDIFLLDSDRDWDGNSIYYRNYEQLCMFQKLKPPAWHRQDYAQLKLLYCDHAVDIVPTTCHTIEELLDSFDWNVSLFGYDGSRTYSRMSPDDIKAGGLLRLQPGHRCHVESTLRRGFRFSERFGMILPEDTVQKLCQDVIAEHVKNQLTDTRPMPDWRRGQ